MRTKKLNIVLVMLLLSKITLAQDITLVDRISGANNIQNLTTIIDWSSIINSFFKLTATNKARQKVNTKQTIGNITYETALNPVMPSTSKVANVTESQYSTASLTGFGSHSWEPILPATSTDVYKYTMSLSIALAGKLQFSMCDIDYNEHFRIHGTNNNGAPVVPNYVLRAASGSNVQATEVAGAYLDIKSNNNVGDAYLFMDVNKNGFIPEKPATPTNMSVS